MRAGVLHDAASPDLIHLGRGIPHASPDPSFPFLNNCFIPPYFINVLAFLGFANIMLVLMF